MCTTRIQQWERKGYDVSSVKKMLNADVQALWDALSEFERRIEKMEILHEKLDAMDTKGFENAVSDINTMMKNPAKLEVVVKAIKHLEQHIQKRTARRRFRQRPHPAAGARRGARGAKPKKKPKRKPKPKPKVSPKKPKRKPSPSTGPRTKTKPTPKRVKKEAKKVAPPAETVSKVPKKAVARTPAEVERSAQEPTPQPERGSVAEVEGEAEPETAAAPARTAAKAAGEPVSAQEVDRAPVAPEAEPEAEAEPEPEHFRKKEGAEALAWDEGEHEEAFEFEAEDEAVDEARVEVAVESEAEARSEAESEGEGEAVAEVDVDAEAEVATGTGAEPEIEIEPEVEAATEPEPEIASEPEAALGLETASDEVLEAAAAAEPEPLSPEARKRQMVLEKFRDAAQLWAEEGYNVSRLEAVLDDDTLTIDMVTDGFRQFDNDIRELRRLGAALDELDTTTFETEREELEALLLDPNRIPTVEKHLGHLRTLVRERTEALDRLEIWKIDGYQFEAFEREHGSFEEMNLENLLQTVEDIEYKITESAKLRDRIDALYGYGLDDELKVLEEELFDLTSLEEIEDEVLKYEIMVDDRRKGLIAQKQPYIAKLAHWEQQGYMVEPLREALSSRSIDDIADAFEEYGSKINRIKKIEKKLERIPMDGFRSTVEMFRKRIKDPTQIDDIETAFMELWTHALKARVMSTDSDEEDEERPSQPPTRRKRGITLGDLGRRPAARETDAEIDAETETDTDSDSDSDSETAHRPAPGAKLDGDTDSAPERESEATDDEEAHDVESLPVFTVIEEEVGEADGEEVKQTTPVEDWTDFADGRAETVTMRPLENASTEGAGSHQPAGAGQKAGRTPAQGAAPSGEMRGESSDGSAVDIEATPSSTPTQPTPSVSHPKNGLDGDGVDKDTINTILDRLAKKLGGSDEEGPATDDGE